MPTDGPSRWSNPLGEPHGRIGQGAVLYDIRDPERRPCCREGGRCLAHVVGVYEETATEEVYFRVQDGTHTTEHWCHQGDLLALYEPAGWSVDTAVKPTYALTRRHGVDDHHDVMTDGGRDQSTEVVKQGQTWLCNEAVADQNAVPEPHSTVPLWEDYPRFRASVIDVDGDVAELVVGVGNTHPRTPSQGARVDKSTETLLSDSRWSLHVE